jgi:hypothetical protein
MGGIESCCCSLLLHVGHTWPRDGRETESDKGGANGTRTRNPLLAKGQRCRRWRPDHAWPDARTGFCSREVAAPLLYFAAVCATRRRNVERGESLLRWAVVAA